MDWALGLTCKRFHWSVIVWLCRVFVAALWLSPVVARGASLPRIVGASPCGGFSLGCTGSAVVVHTIVCSALHQGSNPCPLCSQGES